MVKKRQSFSVRSRTRVKMEVTASPEPGAAGVFVGDPAEVPDAYMKGDGLVDSACGRCGFVLLEGVEAAQVEQLVFRCMTCGAFNRVAPARR